MNEEKRRFLRLSVNVEVNFSVLDERQACAYSTASKNLSAGGICIVSFRPVLAGSLLDLRFAIPGLDRFILSKGKVVWVSELNVGGVKSDKGYELGVEFIDIKEEDRKKIQDYTVSGS